MSSPKAGDLVHVRFGNAVCVPGRIEEVSGAVLVIDCSVGEPKYGKHTTSTHDESRLADGSWHWPHDHQPPSQPSLNIEGLARLNLRPDEILAVTLGWPDLQPYQLQEFEEYLTGWLAMHGQPVAGVMVLPQGSQLAAIRAPEPVTHEQVVRGEKSLNDYRRYLGMKPVDLEGP